MKKIVSALAAITVAATSMGSATAFAEENTDTEREFKRPAFCQMAEEFKGGFRFGAERKTVLSEEEKAERLEKVMAVLAEKLAEGKLTQEEYDTAVANLESGNFTFDRKSFGDIKEKFADLTEEEKAEIKEKSANKDIPVEKFKGFKKFSHNMKFKNRTTAEENIQ